MLEYPSVLPLPLRSGVAYERISPMQRSPDRVNGPRTRRKRFKSTPSYLNVTFQFKSSEQAEIFETWLELALNSATNRFRMPLKHPNATGSTWHGHKNFAMYEVCFDDWPKGASLAGGSIDVWEYTATIELRKTPFKSQEWLLDRLTGYPGGMSALNARLLNIFTRWDTDAWRDDPK